MAGSQFGMNKAALMHKHQPTITSEANIEHIVGHIRADGETAFASPPCSPHHPEEQAHTHNAHRPRNRPRNQTSSRWGGLCWVTRHLRFLPPLLQRPERLASRNIYARSAAPERLAPRRGQRERRGRRDRRPRHLRRAGLCEAAQGSSQRSLGTEG